jgi:hypothetical protein
VLQTELQTVYTSPALEIWHHGTYFIRQLNLHRNLTVN